MITLSKSGNSVTFTFDENSGYLQNGTIDVPVNSLALITDESDMATFRKSASNDIFISARYEEFGMSKAELEAWYKANMVSSGGGGGTGGTTPEEVQQMIDSSISGKTDTSAFTAFSGDVQSTLDEIETVAGAAFNDLNDRMAEKLDTSAYTPSDYSAGRGISIDSGNTISLNVPIFSGTGTDSIVEGYTGNTASGIASHAEGNVTVASGHFAHAEGNSTSATSNSSHAEGQGTLASNTQAHAEGNGTLASGYYAHSEGYATSATSNSSHAEGFQTLAKGYASHSEGYGTKANNQSEHASGKYNVSNSGSTDADNTLFSVGNGTADNARHNAFEIRQNGDIYLTSGGTDIKLQDHLGGGGGSGVTSGEVQTMIDNSISGKQDTLISGTNIKTINNISLLGSGNIDIQGGGGTGTCTVDETTMFDIYGSGSYNNDALNMKVRYVVLDFTGDKTEQQSINVYVQFRDDNYTNYVQQDIYLDYTTSSYTLSDQSQAEYIDVTYDSTIEDFKIAVATAYQSTIFVGTINFWHGNIKVPFYTIASGSPCTVIENDVTSAISETRNTTLDGLKSAYLNTQKNSITFNTQNNRGTNSETKIQLDELDGSNNTLKPDIYVGLGTSGWTEIDITQSQCSASELKGTKFRVTYDYSEFNSYNMNLQLSVSWAGNQQNDTLAFDDQTQLPSIQSMYFTAATVDWNASTKELVITYPTTIDWYGELVPVNIVRFENYACQFGQTISKLESYGEDKQALKPYVKETRAALGGLSLVKLTQAQYDALAPDYDANTLYIIKD